VNEEIKKRWVEALRSGDYEKGRRYMRVNDKFCALGVLCDLHAKETGIEWNHQEYMIDKFYPCQSYLGLKQFPHREVYEWAGLDQRAKLRVPKSPDFPWPIAKVNDFFCTFDELADLIEEQF
jgi:hypothetical protein